MSHALRLRSGLLALLGALPGLWLSACNSQPSRAAADAPDGIARQPYSSKELARAHPVGTYTLYHITAKGQPAMQRRTVWTRADGQGCSMDNFDWPVANPEQVQQSAGTATWDELRAHASFPAALTDISSTTIEVPAGRFECWLYRFEEPAPPATEGAAAPAGGALNLFWFAKHSPGSPLRYQVQVAGETVFEMELLETNRLSNS